MEGTWKGLVVNVFGWQIGRILRWPCRIRSRCRDVQLSGQHVAA